MKIELVDSAVGRPDGRQFALTLLVNDTVAIDAGCLGLLAPLAAQKKVRHVFLTHCHMDHIASLPMFLDNVYEPTPECPTIHASEAVWDCLRRHVFNDRIWPDMIRLSREETPFLRMDTLQSEVPVQLNGLRVTPLPLDHAVPCHGFLLEEPSAAVAILTDTLPVTGVWSRLNATENLRGVFLEASFPDSMQWLAEKATHLTPRMFAEQLQLLDRQVPVHAMHLKPAFHDAIARELRSLDYPALEVVRPGVVYKF